MRKVIERKIYDTDTATELAASESSNAYQGDFEYWQEGLYRTSKGAFFIAGNGGPMSSYGQSGSGASMTAGSNLYLISREDAIQWLEDHDHAEILEREFPDAIEEG